MLSAPQPPCEPASSATSLRKWPMQGIVTFKRSGQLGVDRPSRWGRRRRKSWRPLRRAAFFILHAGLERAGAGSALKLKHLPRRYACSGVGDTGSVSAPAWCCRPHVHRSTTEGACVAYPQSQSDGPGERAGIGLGWAYVPGHAGAVAPAAPGRQGRAVPTGLAGGGMSGRPSPRHPTWRMLVLPRGTSGKSL